MIVEYVIKQKEVIALSKLIYGKNRQVEFIDESEKQEAIQYMRTSDNVEFVYENNQEQGAWGPEKRIHFKNEHGVPECLKRNMTAGRSGIYGRINCEELYDEVRAEC